MRALAIDESTHPSVCVLGGACEAIPVADDAVEAALLFGAWHHVDDRDASAVELARVVRAGGTLLMRTSPSDR
jgi:ubiquinone/menaquinone biosynthesis C-methylase UbiE